MTTATIEKPARRVGVSDRARALRPSYFARLDALVASGKFAIEDERETHPPSGRTYAD